MTWSITSSINGGDMDMVPASSEHLKNLPTLLSNDNTVYTHIHITGDDLVVKRYRERTERERV